MPLARFILCGYFSRRSRIWVYISKNSTDRLLRKSLLGLLASSKRRETSETQVPGGDRYARGSESI